MNTSSFISFSLKGEGRNLDFTGESRACNPNKRHPSPAQSAGAGGWGVRDKINVLCKLDKQICNIKGELIYRNHT
jgi:hypothetical protein